MLLLIKDLVNCMRSSRIYKAAREYLGLSRECVCSVLRLDMEDLIAIEDMGLSPSLDVQGQLCKLYGIDMRTDEEIVEDLIKEVRNNRAKRD